MTGLDEGRTLGCYKLFIYILLFMPSNLIINQGIKMVQKADAGIYRVIYSSEGMDLGMKKFHIADISAEMNSIRLKSTKIKLISHVRKFITYNNKKNRNALFRVK